MTQKFVQHVEEHFLELDEGERKDDKGARTVEVEVGFGVKKVPASQDAGSEVEGADGAVVDCSVLCLTMRRLHLGTLSSQIPESTTFEVQLTQEALAGEDGLPICTGIDYDHLNGLLSARGVPKQAPGPRQWRACARVGTRRPWAAPGDCSAPGAVVQSASAPVAGGRPSRCTRHTQALLLRAEEEEGRQTGERGQGQDAPPEEEEAVRWI